MSREAFKRLQHEDVFKEIWLMDCMPVTADDFKQAGKFMVKPDIAKAAIATLKG